MGKHNGKARKTGISVGSALVNRARKEGRNGTASSYLYTTDMGKDGGGIQSVINQSDLEDLMSMAELADRNFGVDRGEAVVIRTGPVNVGPVDPRIAEQEREKAGQENKDALRIPRRPPWRSDMTPDELDAQERASFLEWRRKLAGLEGISQLVLTPFEKNLNVWRQLWRVIERSDIVVQVVDARDPLTYWNEDLKDYCLELDSTKKSILLLNKADMIPERLRIAWANYFDEKDIQYVFWSAKQAADQSQGEAAKDTQDERVALYRVDELIEYLHRQAIDASYARNKSGREDGKSTVGLIGYPNVGKSSTINALFGSKKTAVAATPGKTKHFQTLFVSNDLCLCDCPGLVMPRFAKSKADMVAAGVIPIDRLTDIMEPVQVITERVHKTQLEAIYGIQIKTSSDLRKSRHQLYPEAHDLLFALAYSRGWSGAGGLPDITRAGRRVLKDYVDGKLLSCSPPPNSSPEIIQLAARIAASAPGTVQGMDDAYYQDEGLPGNPSNEGVEGVHDDDADLNLDNAVPKVKASSRPAYKFHKKAARSKVRGAVLHGGMDEDSFAFGKKGGLRR